VAGSTENRKRIYGYSLTLTERKLTGVRVQQKNLCKKH
jgi:hypothetical protein